MSLTSVLDADLATAQDSQTRKPHIRITSQEATASIPFDGQFLTAETHNEQTPASLMHSTGRLILAYRRDDLGANDKLVVAITGSDRVIFSSHEVSVTAGRDIDQVSIVEISATRIGIITLEKSATTYYLHRYTIDLNGTVISQADIDSWAIALFAASPHVEKLPDGSFLLVFIKYVLGPPDHYHLFKSTSATFGTWATASQFAPAGLTPTEKLKDCSLVSAASDDLLLWLTNVDDIGPNGEEMTNIYYSQSADNGASWSTVSALTHYATYSSVGNHPEALMRHDGSMDVIFNEVCGALHMDQTTALWGDGGRIQNMHFDTVNRKLYCVVSDFYTGSGVPLSGVAKVDVDSWAVDKFWDFASVPAFQAFWDNEACTQMFAGAVHGEAGIQPIINAYGDTVALLDGEGDTITEFYFNNDLTYGWTQNVTWTPLTSGFYTETGASYFIHAAWYDSASSRLYLWMGAAVSGFTTIHIGYIDLTESGPPYTFHDIVTDINTFNEENLYLAGIGEGGFYVSPADDIIIISCGNYVTTWKGVLAVFTLSTGALWKSFTVDSHPGFPYTGLHNIAYYNGKVYGAFYYSAYQASTRGLCIIDVASEVITFDRPTWASIDEYYLRAIKVMDATKIAITSLQYGITIYDLASHTWDLFSNSNVPGLTQGGDDSFQVIDYDSVNGMIFTGTNNSGAGAWQGLVMFSQYGFIKQAKRINGVVGGTWVFGSSSDLVIEHRDGDCVAVEDPSDFGMYAFWVKTIVLEDSIKWDKEVSTFDLSKYLLAGRDITAEKSIDKPSTLEFSVSNGHYFDPHNALSLYSIYLKKGRRLALSYGEWIPADGAVVWQAWGTFVVTQTSLSYKILEYPVMNVNAEDRRVFWNHELIATTTYSNSPEDILLDLIGDNTDFDPADIIIPTFDGSSTLYAQWMEKEINDIANQIANRFGYYLRLTVDDDVSARKISDGNVVDHAYSDSTKIIEFSPDDTYSDLTNRVIAMGTERDFIEVLYAEERVGELNGSHAWNSGTKNYDVYYSADQSRRCRSPRLQVIDTITTIGFELAGGLSESISYVDPLEKYCTVTVDSPDLTPELIAALAALLAECLIFDWVQTVPATGTGKTIPWGRYIETITLIVVLQILASTGTFQYEIWAKPVGYVRRSVQATADDLAGQAEAGMVVTKKFEDSLCYSSADCAVVAQFELNVAKWQRNRVTFKKIADLRDEDGDTISILHPYSNQVMKIFITNLKRIFTFPSGPNESGGFFDQIEGWKL